MLDSKKITRFLSSFEKQFVPHNIIEVSRSAILYNLELFAKLVGMPAIPVIKANAYGHGIAVVAEALRSSGVPYIAVDGYFEALRVRKVSKVPVLILGAIAAENYQNIKYDNFAFVVDNEESIRALAKTRKRVNVHLEINTGMNRYGAKTDEVIKLVQLILSFKNLTFEGVMSHLADSDGSDESTVKRAVASFDTCVEAVHKTGANPSFIHIAQSAGSIKAKSKYANSFRLGIGLYGVNPYARSHKLHKRLKDLRPALKFTSTITKMIKLNEGDKVSYNYTFTAPKSLNIGVVPVGYHEGLNRSLSNTGLIKVGSKYAPIVGRVCMNHTMINLDGLSASVGDKVVIYSNNPTDKNSIDNIAEKHNLFNYNLLTNLSYDIRRRLVK